MQSLELCILKDASILPRQEKKKIKKQQGNMQQDKRVKGNNRKKGAEELQWDVVNIKVYEINN